MISEFHESRTNVTLLLLCSDVLNQKQCCVKYPDFGKVFCKSIAGSFDRSKAYREDKYVLKISILKKPKCCLSIMEMVQYNQPTIR